MRRLVGPAALSLLVLMSEPAAALDPFAERPVSTPTAPAPLAAAVPAPLPATVPSGIYRVTDVYAGNVVSRAGPVTTYSTATVRDDPGTYARVLETVNTGSASRYDGAAFNGRTALSDGRPIAGTYYENFVVTRGQFVPVSVVFFQDDRELAAQRRPVPTAPPAPPAPTPRPTAAPAPTRAPVRAAASTPRPVVRRTPRPTPTPKPTPRPPRRTPRPVRAVASPAPTPAPVPTPAPRVPVIVPGVATSPLGEIAGSIVVIRGRPIELWVRAIVDGRTQAVSGWRILSGEHVALGPMIGLGGEPFRARWDDVTVPGAAWITQVEANVNVAGTTYTIRGDVRVAVRSPALIR